MEQTKTFVESWNGRPYRMDYDHMMHLFRVSGYPETGLNSIEAESDFQKAYYTNLLRGVNENKEYLIEYLIIGDCTPHAALPKCLLEHLGSPPHFLIRNAPVHTAPAGRQ